MIAGWTTVIRPLHIFGIDRLRVASFCISVIRRLGVIAVCALIFSASLRFANSAHGIHLSYLAPMSLLVFSILVLTIGIDIRRRGMAALVVGRPFDGLTADGFVAIGGWISFLGAIWLNISVWQLF